MRALRASPAIKIPRNKLYSIPLSGEYDQAFQHLIDLRDLAELENGQAAFKKRLAEFRGAHAAKKSLIDRLNKGGL